MIENGKNNCAIVQDLIPLVKDGIASAESAAFVQTHTMHCKQCSAIYEQGEAAAPPTINDRRLLSGIRKKLSLFVLLALAGGACFGVAMTSSTNMFYNILLMPLLGGLFYLLLRRAWPLMPLAIAALTVLWGLAQSFVLGEAIGPALSACLLYALIYALLSALGAAIAFLLRYALSKGDPDEKENAV